MAKPMTPMVSPIAFYCNNCGYDLRGGTAGKCPECGLAVTIVGLGHGSWRPEWRWAPIVSRLLGAQILVWGTIPLIANSREPFLLGLPSTAMVAVAVIHNAVSLPAPIIALAVGQARGESQADASIPVGFGLFVVQGMTVVAAAILGSLW